MSNPLKLYEALMLLSLREEEGTMNGVYVEYATAGAIAAELLMLGRIKVDTDNKDKVAVVDYRRHSPWFRLVLSA